MVGRRRSFALFAKDRSRPVIPVPHEIFSFGDKWGGERSIHFRNTFSAINTLDFL